MTKEDADLYRLIVEEVDEARETLELVGQLREGLPIKSFEDLRAASREGTLELRGERHPVDQFEDYLPAFVFPIDDLPTLVSRVALFLKAVPDSFGRDDPRRAKGDLRRLGMLGLPNGWPNNAALAGVGPPTRGSTASVEEGRRSREEK